MAEKTGKKKKGRRAYLGDFRPGVGGDYVYTGSYRRFEGDEAALKAFQTRVGGAAGLAAAALVAAGCMSAPGSTDRFYVILPWLAALTAAFVCAWKAVRLLSGGATLREYVYAATAPKLPGWALAGAIACGLTLLAEAVCLALRGFEGRAPAALGFLALTALALAALLLLRSFSRKGVWTEQK